MCMRLLQAYRKQNCNHNQLKKVVFICLPTKKSIGTSDVPLIKMLTIKNMIVKLLEIIFMAIH